MATLRPNPDSNRSKKRAARKFTGSRAVRRAERRKSIGYGYFAQYPKGPESGFEHRKPGKTEHW